MAGTSNHPSAAEMETRLRAACEKALTLSTEHLLTESRRLAPIEEGPLERSGKATVDGMRGAVSFATPYAVRQHEDMTYRHDAGRQAKYLEQPATTEAATISRIHATTIERAMS